MSGSHRQPTTGLTPPISRVPQQIHIPASQQRSDGFHAKRAVARAHFAGRRAFHPTELARRLSDELDSLLRTLVKRRVLYRNDNEVRFGSLGSLRVFSAGHKKGRFDDFEAGVSGDALDLVAHMLGCSTKEACAWTSQWLGLDRSILVAEAAPHCFTTRQPARSDIEAVRKQELAQKLWRDAWPAQGSVADNYYASRGLIVPGDAPLRFHPACPRGSGERLPAVLALMTHPVTAEPCGVHRTFLLPDGRGKALGQAKMMLGSAGIVRLVPDADVTIGLGIAEGIETSLAVMQYFGWRPVWAALSAGGVAKFTMLDGIEVLTIFVDMDDRGAGLNAAVSCAERWIDAGRTVRIVAPRDGEDFNDTARRVAP